MAQMYWETEGDRAAIYEAVERWKEQCLYKDGSLWTNASIWTAENLQHFYERLTKTPLVDKRSFDEKLQLQLAGAPQSIYQLAIEVLYIYYLFPYSGSVRYETKLRKLNDVAAWGNIPLLEQEDMLQALKLGLGATGTFYNTAKWHEIIYIVQVALGFKEVPASERPAILRRPESDLKRVLEQAKQFAEKNVQMHHILAHLLAPHYYECIASGSHKEQIANAFFQYIKHAEEDIDRKLFDIRQALEEEGTYTPVHYYHNAELYERWQAGSVVQEDNIRYETPTERDWLAGLVFDDEAGVLKTQIDSALKSGKHIILTGAPGTGKSTLAKRICDYANMPYTLTTASPSWTSYDTLGGYHPTRQGTLTFQPGIVLKTIKPTTSWLIVDEINRTNVDQAFGALLSVLAGDSVTLPYEHDNGRAITIRRAETTDFAAEEDYIIPSDWRIIGTMNTRDKSSLFELSYAFMRRFAFIPVPIPRVITTSLMEAYLREWALPTTLAPLLAQLWQHINTVRKIGPALMEDVARYCAQSGQEDIASALILYVLPQFEGVPPHRLQAWLQTFATDFDDVVAIDILSSFCEDFFEMEPLYEA